MNKKTILKFNSTKSVRPFAWLALAILAVGAFGNSVQAQAWLNENFFNYTAASLSTTTSPNLINAGAFTLYTTVVNDGGNVARYSKTSGGGTGGTGSQVMFGFSPNTTTPIAARTSGYVSFKIKQNVNPNPLITTAMELNVGIGNNATATSTSTSKDRFIGLSFKQTGTATGAVTITRGDGTANQNVIANASYANSTSFSTVEVWFNDSDSAGMPYKDPSGNSQTLPINSFAVYVNKTLITTPTFYGGFATSGNLNFGKIGFSTSSTSYIDFSFDDIYAAASAPLAILSPSTATTSVGSTFNYTISTTAVSGVTFTTPSNLPPGLSLNETTGLISGQPTTPGTYGPITLTATVGGTTVTAPLTIEVTAVPTVYTWNNQGTSWSSGTSWTNGTAPATSALIDTAQFGNLGSSATDVNVGSGNTIKGIVFDPGAYAYTWTGTDIKVLSSGAITNNSSVAQTFNNKMINSGNATWSSVASESSMVFNGGIDLSDSSANNTLTFAGAGNATLNGAIADGGGSTGGAVTFTSTGTNLLSGNNTYRGATRISSGATLKIGSATALGSAIGSTVVSSGGVLDLNGQTVSGETLSLEGSGISANGALVNTSINDANWGGPVALVSTTSMNASSRKITVSGVVSGGTLASTPLTKIGAGTLELSGTNTYIGTTDIQNGTMILSESNNSGTLYKIGGSADNINPVLRLTATNVLSPSANLTGVTSQSRTGTLELAASGNYTLNAYTNNNMNFSNSSGSRATLTFTNLNSTLSTGGGRYLTNLSTDLTVTFNGQLDIGGNGTDSCGIAAIGPVVISNRIYSLSNTVTRSFVKRDTGILTIYGTNSYNGTTTVSGGTLLIPAKGSLVGCGDTIVKGSVTTATLASLNLGGAAGVVQVSTNGFVRGDTNGSTTTLGTISSLQVQNLGTVQVALRAIWSTGGTIDFATGSKVLVTGTPVVGQGPYTLMTASGTITGTVPTLSPAIPGWNLDFSGPNLILEETPPNPFEILNGTLTFSEIISGGIPLDKRGDGTAIITGSNTFSGGTVLGAGILEVQNSNGLGTGAVTLTSGTLRSTVDLNLGRLVGATTSVGNAAYQAVYGINSRLQYSGLTTTINGPVTLDVGDGTTMTMGNLIGNSSAGSLVTKIGAGTVKLMGGNTKPTDAAALAANGSGSTVLGGWKIQEGTVWFEPSANNGAGNGPIILAGGTAKFSKLQNSNGTYTGFTVPSDLTVESSGLIQFDPNPATLLGQNNLEFKNLSIGVNTLEVATATTSTVVGQGLPSVNFKSATLTGSATLENPVNLDLNLQAVSGGSGFTKTGLGTLYLSDQPNRAAAFATLTSGGVESIVVEYAGSGYLEAPTVTVEQVNGGSGAQATATIDSNGRVTSIAVTAAGSGYNSSPRVVIAAPPTVATANSYAGATIVDQGKLNLSGSYVSSVTVNPGATLQLDWLAPAEAKCSIDGISLSSSPNASYSYVKNLYLTKSVGGYVPSTTFDFDLPAPAKVDGTGTATGTATYVLAAARARATVDSNGFISALSIVSGGSGYAITPMVAIPAPTEPTVVATTTGSITFESGAKLSVNNPPIGTGASCTLLTANGGILGAELPGLLNLPGYVLTKSSDGKSLILTDTRTGPTFSADPTAGAISYGQSLAPSNLNSAGLTSVPGSFAWKNAGTLLSVGTSSQIVIFTPSDLTAYRPAEFTVSVTVSKANPTVTWPTAGAITYGDALSAAVFSGASTNGNFAFTSPETIPNAGVAQIFEVTFTPTDAVNYNTLRQNVTVTVNKANPTVTWPTAGAITYGDALSAAVFSGASTNGNFAFTSPATVPAAGIAQNFEVIFTPEDTANYNTLRQNVAVTVNKANATVTWPTAGAITAGQALSLSTLSGGSATGVGGAIVEGAFAWTDSTTARSTTGSYEVTFTPTSGNYNTATQAVSVTVNPAGTIYNDWLSANGGTASDAAFLDYVFGAATPGALPASLKPTVAVTGGNLVLTYYVRQGTLGLTVAAQTSANLATGEAGWSTSGVIDVPVGEPTTAVNGVRVQQRTASVSVSGGRKFLRIQAVQAAP